MTRNQDIDNTINDLSTLVVLTWLQAVKPRMGVAERVRWMVIMKVMVAEKKRWAQIGGEIRQLEKEN